MDDGDRSTSTTTTMDGNNDDEFTMCEAKDDYEYVYDFDDTTSTVLICDDNEELFQLSYFGLLSQTRPVPYKVTNRATGEVHAECSYCENNGNTRNVQLCLPKDQCYTVVAGVSKSRGAASSSMGR